MNKIRIAIARQLARWANALLPGLDRYIREEDHQKQMATLAQDCARGLQRQKEDILAEFQVQLAQQRDASTLYFHTEHSWKQTGSQQWECAYPDEEHITSALYVGYDAKGHSWYYILEPLVKPETARNNSGYHHHIEAKAAAEVAAAQHAREAEEHERPPE